MQRPSSRGKASDILACLRTVVAQNLPRAELLRKLFKVSIEMIDRLPQSPRRLPRRIPILTAPPADPAPYKFPSAL
jgi:hypothetical protein